MTDAQLLSRFADGREEEAFATLVQRHGPMVLGVCRRMLQDAQAAEDAFQATFLVLARRAGNIRDREAVSSWLYGVACRLAVKLRCQASQRREKEKQFLALQPVKAGPDLLSFVLWQELRPVLDEELGRLPEKYRSPLVLCYLEGKTHDEAADELGWPKGSMSRRMDKARDLLRRRLTQRGITLPAGVIFSVLVQQNVAAVAEPLAQQTLHAAVSFAAQPVPVTGLISPSVASLAQGALHTMSWSIGKLAAGSLLLLTLLGGTTGMLTFTALGQQPDPAVPVMTALAQVPGEGIQSRPVSTGNTAPQRPLASTTSPARSGATAPEPQKAVDDKRNRFYTPQEVHQLLDQPTDYFSRGFQNSEPLVNILNKIADDFNVTIRYNRQALQLHANMDMERLRQVETQMPGIKNVPLRQVLRELLAQVDGETTLGFTVKGNQIVIEPVVDIYSDDPKAPALPLRELVSLTVERVPLKNALRQLADATGANILLDIRLQEQADTPVTASFQHVPLYTAVTLLADMAELRVVPLDNVLYVTTGENAQRIERERYGTAATGSGINVGELLPPTQPPAGGGGNTGGPAPVKK